MTASMNSEADSRTNTTSIDEVEFAFAPAERDVYSYEPIPKHVAPVGAKPGSGMIAGLGKTPFAPPELRSKEGINRL
jgi:hypothetical protein